MADLSGTDPVSQTPAICRGGTWIRDQAIDLRSQSKGEGPKFSPEPRDSVPNYSLQVGHHKDKQVLTSIPRNWRKIDSSSLQLCMRRKAPHCSDLSQGSNTLGVRGFLLGQATVLALPVAYTVPGEEPQWALNGPTCLFSDCGKVPPGSACPHLS